MSLLCSEKEKFFKFFSSDVQISIMIENEIYCYVSGNYLDYKFSSNQNQLKTNLTFITLNYHISATFHSISKLNFQNFSKSFVKKVFLLSQFLVHSKLKIIFHLKTQIPNDLKCFLVYKFTCASCNIVLAILANLVII